MELGPLKSTYMEVILKLLTIYWLISAALSAPSSVNATLYALSANNPSPLYALRDTATIHIQDSLFGNRKVAYWVDEQGQAIIDGDIIFGSEEDLLNKKITPPSESDHAKRSFSILEGAETWPHAEIVYKYDSAATEATLSGFIEIVVNRWLAVAPFLRFTKQAASSVPVNGVLTITANDCGGCVSTIGYSSTQPRSMNLQQDSAKCHGFCHEVEATHEFGHALGLKHEHQRPDRETYVTYNCANLDPNCDAGFSVPTDQNCCMAPIAGCCKAAGNFFLDTSTNSDSNSPYDVNSIMHYTGDAFALPGKRTLTQGPAPAGLMPPLAKAPNPDPGDALRVCKLYSGQCPKAQQCEGCPANCRLLPTCPHNPHCNDRNPPRCCDIDLNELCLEQRAHCRSLDCSFKNIW